MKFNDYFLIEVIFDDYVFVVRVNESFIGLEFWLKFYFHLQI